MTRIGVALLGLTLASCSVVTIADRYGNTYGDWYNPGGDFAWQLGLCEQTMEQGAVPARQRKAAMRCCMHDHGVPVEAAGCAAG
jgi:hypothetical protein